MSKKSKFIFSLGDNKEIEAIENIIKEYLNERGLHFDEKEGYWIRSNSKIGDVAEALSRSGIRGFSYEFDNDTLIIRAWLFNLNHTKTYFIHSVFNNSQPGVAYINDLKHDLFSKLENMNVTLINKEVERG